MDNFNKSKRFAVAASFSGTGNFKMPNDPEIGSIKFYIKSWANPSDSPAFTQLAHRNCTKEDLLEIVEDGENGGDGMTSYGFYPLDPTAKE